jgi:uncharacterized protein (DUF433 family)
MSSEYVEMRNGGYYVKGVRVTLDSIVCCFNEGISAEMIQQNFPVLKLSQVYGAIAFYLDNKAEIDEYVAEGQRNFEKGAIPLEQSNPRLWEKIQRAKAEAAQGERRS